MGVGLGWKEAAPQYPYIDGELWSEGITRSGNRVSFSFNLRLRVRDVTGYWNYAWYVSIKCGNVEVTDKLVKDRVNRNNIIGGQDFWYSAKNGLFSGSIDITGQANSIPVAVTFHDSAGHAGSPQTWNVPIPTASSMSAIRGSVSDISDDSATISGSLNWAGNYSSITKWKLSYGQSGYTNILPIDTNSLSANWNLTNLESGAYYIYKIEVWSSSGYSQEYTGNFFTEDSTIGHLVIQGQPTKILTGWIIHPDGQTQKIKEIRKVT